MNIEDVAQRALALVRDRKDVVVIASKHEVVRKVQHALERAGASRADVRAITFATTCSALYGRSFDYMLEAGPRAGAGLSELRSVALSRLRRGRAPG